MKITNKSQAINVKRDDETNISYYIFNEHEVHYGELAPGVIQPWHHHSIISETICVVEGKTKLHYLDNEEKKEKIVVSGDVVRVENTPHTFSNPFAKTCKMIAFRFIPRGIDQREVIKNDKVLHSELD